MPVYQNIQRRKVLNGWSNIFFRLFGARIHLAHRIEEALQIFNFLFKCFMMQQCESLSDLQEVRFSTKASKLLAAEEITE